MKKEGQARYNRDYWAENEAMLRQPVYAQQIRQDRLTGRDMVAEELRKRKEEEFENEQTKARERQEAEEAKAREEREEFEEWKRHKAERKVDARAQGNTRS